MDNYLNNNQAILLWKSVSKEMPDKNGRYLTVRNGGYEIVWYFANEKRFQYSGVTHWMCLPKMPEDMNGGIYEKQEM